MNNNEKIEKIFKYIFDNYKKESTDYKESKERGDVIRAAKASIRSEILLINWTSRRQEISECRRRT